MNWREQTKRELAATGFLARAIFLLLWATSIGLSVFMLTTIEAPHKATAMVAAIVMSSVPPVLLGISLFLKVGYALTAQRMPRVTNAVEVTAGAAFTIGVGIVLILAAWEDRQRIVAVATDGATLALGVVVGAGIAVGNAFEAMTSLRGLLVIIAILLYQILTRLNQPRR